MEGPPVINVLVVILAVAKSSATGDAVGGTEKATSPNGVVDVVRGNDCIAVGAEGNDIKKAGPVLSEADIVALVVKASEVVGKADEGVGSRSTGSMVVL